MYVSILEWGEGGYVKKEKELFFSIQQGIFFEIPPFLHYREPLAPPLVIILFSFYVTFNI